MIGTTASTLRLVTHHIIDIWQASTQDGMIQARGFMKEPFGDFTCSLGLSLEGADILELSKIPHYPRVHVLCVSVVLIRKLQVGKEQLGSLGRFAPESCTFSPDHSHPPRLRIIYDSHHTQSLYTPFYHFIQSAICLSATLPLCRRREWLSDQQRLRQQHLLFRLHPRLWCLTKPQA